MALELVALDAIRAEEVADSRVRCLRIEPIARAGAAKEVVSAPRLCDSARDLRKALVAIGELHRKLQVHVLRIDQRILRASMNIRASRRRVPGLQEVRTEKGRDR